MKRESALMRGLVRQFSQPRGFFGLLAGWIMARRPSNRERNRRTLDRLGIDPEDRVLELGFGPGLAIQWAAERADRGLVVGIDHSRLMLRQARRRNARGIAAGRVRLHLASVSSLPDLPIPFDKVFGVNVHVFWSDPVSAFRQIHARMRPGGTIALTFQPRQPGATREHALAASERVFQALRAAGFAEVESEVFEMKPVAAVCVLAHRPEEAASVAAGAARPATAPGRAAPPRA